jgi:carbon storage regulator
MLVLTRKVNERIQIGQDVTITIVRIGPMSVRVGIDAPPHTEILRGELIEGQSEAVLAGAQAEIHV